MDGIVALLLSKKFTKDTVIGMGAIKGAACQVQSINKVGKTTTITLKWEDNVGGVHTQAFDVEDGLDGVSVSNATIKSNGHLELTLSNGTTIDCGKVLPQYDTMPTPSSSNEGQILQYIGTTTSNYTNGYFYECINDGGTYKWVEKLVQDSYTKIQIGDLSNLPDNTKNVVENIVDINNKIDDKENIFRYNVIPTADVSINGAIIQYIGVTNATYINGYYYQCVESPIGSGTYVWVQKNVQPNNGGGGGDGVVDGYYNSADQLFYEDSAFLNPITGEDNTIYVDLNTNGLYRYDGTIFIKVSSSAESIQVTTLPTADITQLDKIYQYIGATDTNYTKGYFYRCILDGSVYKWVNIATQDSYTKSEIGQLSDLPDPSKTVIENIDLLNGSVLNIKTDINTLQGSVINVKNDITNLQGSVLNIKTDINTLQGSLANKVDKEAGKGLSTNDYTNDDKQKLVKLSPIYLIGSGLNLDSVTGELTASGIDVPIDTELSDTSINPVQNKVITTKIEQLEASKLSLSDVDNALSGSSINPVQNQVITLAIDQLQGSVLNKIQKMLGAQEDNFTIIDNNGGVKDSGISKDVVPATVSISNKLLVASDLSVKADKVSGATNDDIALLDGTGNLKDSNKKLSDYQEKLTDGNGINIDASNNISLDITYLTASRVGYIPATEKGSNNGVAELDNAGKVPSSQLPSYVDDVIEGYLDSGNFYKDAGHTQLITPEDGKIYVNLADNTTYRWGGTAYVQISSSLALGTTHTTAYYGDLGQTAYNHSQITNGSNPHNTTADNVNLKVPIPALSGSKLDVESTLYGINTELGKKADKVASATSGHLAGLDGNGNLTDSGVVASNVIEKVTTATGLLKDDGTVDTTSYAPSNKAYLTDDTAETTIDDADYFPFYDTSATGKRKTLFSSIVNKLKNTFATLVTGTFTSGNLASLDSSGNIADSGKKASDFQTVSLADFTGDLNTLTSAGYKQYKAKLSDLTNAPTVSYTPMECYIDVWSDTNNVYQTIRIVGLTYSPSAKYSSTFKRSSYNTGSVLSWGAWEQIDNKISIVSGATQNDIAIFDANGGVADSNVLISSLPTILPASNPTPTDASVVSDINSVSASTTKAASAYALQQYSNEKKVRRVITGTTPIGSASIGTTGIGTWDDSVTPTETDWWYDDAFKIPDNRNDIDLSLKFDPSSGEPVTLGGYILDTDTGKLCIKFGNSIATPANAKIAVDITYTRNEFG